MISALRNVLQIPELKQKILFTLVVLGICRVGGFIPVPGINGEIALNYFRQASGGGQNFFQLIDIFSGGAFSQMTVIALGVVPYISASIIMQLLTALWPDLQRELRENPEQGKRKLGKYTRALTIGLAVLQSAMYARYAIQMDLARPGIIAGELLNVTLFGVHWLFFLIFVLTMTTGTMWLMWLGEQITERGIGNGMSLIITLNIVSSLPSAIGMIFQQLNLDSQSPGQMNFAIVGVLLSIFVFVTLATILIIQGHRRVPLQYARRVVGMREVQGGSSYIPLKINYAGVIPVIFSSSLLLFPATLAGFVGHGGWLSDIAYWLSPGSLAYMILYILCIMFFTYFWIATQFRPEQIASDMKKNGAFVPGVRQGKPTQDYLEATMNRVTFLGAVFLALIAILPTLIGKFLTIPSSISYFFGGTALLILVGVVLDTMKQVESHLISKKYEGFMQRGRFKGRT